MKRKTRENNTNRKERKERKGMQESFVLALFAVQISSAPKISNWGIERGMSSV